MTKPHRMTAEDHFRFKHRRMSDAFIREQIDHIYRVSGPEDADIAGCVASNHILELRRRANLTAHEKIAEAAARRAKGKITF